MHHVSRIDPSSAKPPKAYGKNSIGFRRATYVEHGMGSVHMGVGICYLDQDGLIQPHVHSFEESFYILDGNPVVQIRDKTSHCVRAIFGLPLVSGTLGRTGSNKLAKMAGNAGTTTEKKTAKAVRYVLCRWQSASGTDW